MESQLHSVVVKHLEEIPRNKDIWIFGAGQVGNLIYNRLSGIYGTRIKGFIDSFKTGTCCQLPVYAPHQRREFAPDNIVLIAAADEKGVLERLKGTNVSGIINVYPLYLNLLEDIKKDERQIKTLLAQHQPQEALKKLEELLIATPSYAGWYQLWIAAHAALDKEDKAMPVLLSAQRKYPNMALFRCTDFQHKREKSQKKYQPSIFFNTQFKSGSMFLREAFEKGLNLPWMYVRAIGFGEKVMADWVKDLNSGNALAQDHLSSETALAHVMPWIRDAKFVVHIRDPRQSIISAVYYYEKLVAAQNVQMRHDVATRLPENYGNWTFEQKVDHYLGINSNPETSRFYFYVKWVEDWLQAKSENFAFRHAILTDYNDLCSNQAHFTRELVDKLEIDDADFDFSFVDKALKPGQSHFRKGDPNEWREKLTTRQLNAVNAIMTPRLLDRYGK